MSKRDPHGVRVLVAVILVLALSAVYSSSAQSTQLTQVVKTVNGQISVHLPAGWQERDTSSAVYPTVLAFGDTGNSLQAAVNSVTSSQTTPVLGSNGVIAIYAPELTAALSSDLAVQTLFNTIANATEQEGGQILQEQSTSVGGLYPGTVALVDTPSLQAKGIFGAFAVGSNVVVFSVGASPEATFDANQQLFEDIVNSIRVPAEAGSTTGNSQAQPTPAPSNNTNNAQPQTNNTGTETLSVGKNGTFSVDLPQGWVNETRADVTSFTDVVVFGSNQQAMQVSNDSIVNGGSLTPFQGVAGFIGAVDVSQLGGAQLSAVVAPLLQRLTQIGTSAGAKTVGNPQTENVGGKYPGEVQELDIGYIAVMHSTDQVLVAIVISDDKATNDSTMLNIIESIQIPAAGGQQQPTQTSGELQPTTTTSTEQAPAETTTFRSSDNQVSLDLPSNWTVLDHMADGEILAYGDTPDAAMSRLYSVKPDLATKTAISGNGGVVVLYPMSQFGIDPSRPDLMPLITRALGNLKGYTVSQQPQAVPGLDGAVFAIISGTEHGYLVLIPFGDQIAYVTATGTTDADFNVLQTTFQNIVASIHVPALPIPTATPEGAGLGGLGGLEATSEATPESAGLGGLGGLGGSVATPNATPES